MANPLMFLKEKPQTGVVTEHRSEKEEDSSNPGLEASAQDLMEALERKDVKGVAMALENAFALLESMPHEEASEMGDE